jgi:hypothetical protein
VAESVPSGWLLEAVELQFLSEVPMFAIVVSF